MVQIQRKMRERREGYNIETVTKVYGSTQKIRINEKEDTS